MNSSTSKTVIAQMDTPKRPVWIPVTKKEHHRKRLLRNASIFAAVSICLGIGAYSFTPNSQEILAHLTAGFEYDDTLGRLQYVSNILPESAMVFLSNDSLSTENYPPIDAPVSHPWTQNEPWLEYVSAGEISACQSGEVMTIVENSDDRFTVRILHENGFESVYSGLQSVSLSEHDQITAGQRIGTVMGTAAFELRKDGLSIVPVFAERFK